MSIGLACRALGDEDGSELELEAARAMFEQLGAIPDVRRVDAVARARATPAASQFGLSSRELEVLRLVAAGSTNKEIAAALFVSERTVDRHVSNIFAKLDVNNRTAAARWAVRAGLVD